MTNDSIASNEPAEPNPDAVEEEYGDLAAVYAESRAEAAQALGRETSARKWRNVEGEIETDGAGNTDD